MSNEMTFEQIDAHIKNARLSDYQPGGKMHFKAEEIAAQPGNVLQKICGIYKVIRPILSALSKLPLIPAAWKTAITTFMGLMDSLCP